MQPSQIDNRQEDIFRGRLSSELNPKNEILVLSRLIPWSDLEVEFADLYQSNSSVGGQPPKPIRLMIGILFRDVERKIKINPEQKIRENFAEIFSSIFNQTRQLLLQEKNSKNKIYSLREFFLVTNFS